jgi:hypothetical protein
MPGLFDENGSYFTNDDEAILFDEYEFDEETSPEFDNPEEDGPDWGKLWYDTSAE